MEAQLLMTVCDLPRTVTPPSVIKIAPWGTVETKGRGSFVIDEVSANLIVAAMKSHGLDVPIDYEHQTLGGDRARPDGLAPAAGWIHSVEARPGDGLYARVSWTEPGARAVASLSYRFVSPVLMKRGTDGRAVALHSVALTNKPATINATPIAASEPRPSFSTAGESAARLSESQVRTAAGLEYDGSATLARLCTREAYIADQIREAGRATLANRSWREAAQGRKATNSIDQRGSAPNRAALVDAAGRDWDAAPRLIRKLASRAAFVNDALRSAGVALLSSREREEMDRAAQLRR